MVKIRLNRMGRKNFPFYRIVVTDSRRARDGKYIEAVGYYNPLKEEVKIDTERVAYWLSCGAKTTEIVNRLLKKKKDTGGEL
ncbi:MAG: 30S ribosomal protein S16 [candidate division WOR-3 bacterium]